MIEAHPTSPFSCGIVEDQTMFRSFLVRLLSDTCKMRVPLIAESLAELQQAMPRIKGLDLLILDVRLPDGDALDLVLESATSRLMPPVLLLSAACDDFVVHRATGSVIRGFVHKEDDCDVLISAVTAITRGGTYFSERFLERRARLSHSESSFAKILSRREQSLLGYLGSGLSDAEAAAAVGISAATVHVHRRNIMKKLDIHSAVGLQAYALRGGFTTIHELSVNRPPTCHPV